MMMMKIMCITVNISEVISISLLFLSSLIFLMCVLLCHAKIIYSLTTKIQSPRFSNCMSCCLIDFSSDTIQCGAVDVPVY